MANRALYRKYRPRTFAEVIGQEHVTAPLIQALKNGKLNHAYLFSGPRGCGKTSSARILARSLNCVNGPTPDPCGVCDSCLALAPDGPGSLDVVEIDAASHGGVDDARDLRERAFFAPVNSRFKVYVIDEAHMVSSQGFNALLKLVEEPPDFVKFVFATTEPDKVLQTIRSRTHHYPFRLIPPNTMVGLLDRICTDESVTIEKTVLPLVVRAGGGSARDSLSILDQLLAGAGEQGVTYQHAVALLGVTDSGLLDEATAALAAADGAALYGVVDRVVDAGHDPRRFASDLLERLRDLVILATVPDAAAKGLVDAPADELDRMALLANQLGVATASRMADVVHNGLVEMRGTTSPRLLLELVCARMLLPAADESQAALLQRLERLERRLAIAGEGGPVSVTPSVTTPGEPARPNVSAAVAEPPRPTPPPVTPPRPQADDRPAAVVPAQTPAPISRPAPAAAASGPGAAPAGAGTAPAGYGGAPTGSGGAPGGPGGVSAGAGGASAGAGVAPAGYGGAPAGYAGAASGGQAASGPGGGGAHVAPAQQTGGVSGGSAAAPAGGMDAAAVRQVWPQIVEQTKQRSRMVWALVQNATPREVRGDELVVTVKHQGEVRRLSDEKCTSVLQKVLLDVLGVRWKIRAEAEGGPGGGGSGRRGPAPPPGPAPVPPMPAAPAPVVSSGGGDWPTIAPVGGQAAPGVPAVAASDGSAALNAPAVAGGAGGVGSNGGASAGAVPGGGAPNGGAPFGGSPVGGGPVGGLPAGGGSFGAQSGGGSFGGSPSGGSFGGAPSGGSPGGGSFGGSPGGGSVGGLPGGDSGGGGSFGGSTGGGSVGGGSGSSGSGLSGVAVGGAVRNGGGANGSGGNGSRSAVVDVARPPGGVSVVVEDDDVPLPPEPVDPMYDGFDPDDEPYDDANDLAVGRAIDSEKDAIALLEQHLGARQID